MYNEHTNAHYMYNEHTSAHYMYNEHTNAHLIDSLLYCSLFIAATCSNTNPSSSGDSYSVRAKLHKHVHADLVVFF
jgi:hypothetical protein